MRFTCSELQHQLPIRPRIALSLAVAGRVVPALAKNTEAFKAAQKALSDGWRWEEGEQLRALQMYEDDVEGLAVQGSLIKDKEESAAMCAVTAAFYYMLWHAFRQDLSSGQVRQGDIYNDIAEVTEAVVDEVCDSATQTSVCDDAWIASAVNKLLRDFRCDNPDDLGPTISQDYFAT